MRLTRVLACLTLAAATAPLASAQGFTVEQVMSSPFPSELTSASHASRIAWVFDARGSRNVWVADAPSFVPRQLTHYTGDDGQEIDSLRLTPDGQAVLYARGSELNGAGLAANPTHEDKQPKQQVWMASAASAGEPRLLGEMACPREDCEDIQISPDGRWAVWSGRHQLWLADLHSSTAAKQLTEIRGDVASPAWSPDSTRIAATIARGDHAFVSILDLKDGALCGVHYVAPSVDRDLAPRWSPDGSKLAFLRVRGVAAKQTMIPWHPEPWALWTADTHTYTGSELWKSGETLRDSLPEFGPAQLIFAQDARIVFASEADGRDHLYSISPAGGPPVLLTRGDFDVEDVSLSRDGKSILLASNAEDVDRRHIWRVAVVGGAPPEPVSWNRAASAGTIEWAPVDIGDGKTIACLGSTATSPALVYRAAAGARELISTDALPKDFPTAQLVTPTQVLFKSSDGLTIHGQLFVPHGQTRPGPALIFTHGGPKRQMLLGFHYRDYYHNAYAENQYLASLGYTVLSVNYRLGIMYGADFREPPNSGWRGAAEYNDVLAGARYLQSLPNVNPRQIGLWGGSYGGFLTALGLARNSDIFKAGVDFHGVHDWTTQVRFDDGPAAAPDLDAARKLAFSSSPNSALDGWKSPVLLIQGDDDRNVQFSQMVTLVQKLREHGTPFEQTVYPDEIHGFLLWHDWVRSYTAEAEFFERHLPTH